MVGSQKQEYGKFLYTWEEAIELLPRVEVTKLIRKGQIDVTELANIRIKKFKRYYPFKDHDKILLEIEQKSKPKRIYKTKMKRIEQKLKDRPKDK